MDTTLHDKIVTLFNLETLEKTQQEETVHRLSELIFESAMARAMAVLDENEATQLDQAFSEDMAPEEMISTITNMVPDFPNMVAEELVRLHKHVLSTQQASQASE